MRLPERRQTPSPKQTAGPAPACRASPSPYFQLSPWRDAPRVISHPCNTMLFNCSSSYRLRALPAGAGCRHITMPRRQCAPATLPISPCGEVQHSTAQRTLSTTDTSSRRQLFTYLTGSATHGNTSALAHACTQGAVTQAPVGFHKATHQAPQRQRAARSAGTCHNIRPAYTTPESKDI